MSTEPIGRGDTSRVDLSANSPPTRALAGSVAGLPRALAPVLSVPAAALSPDETPFLTAEATLAQTPSQGHRHRYKIELVLRHANGAVRQKLGEATVEITSAHLQKIRNAGSGAGNVAREILLSVLQSSNDPNAKALADRAKEMPALIEVDGLIAIANNKANPVTLSPTVTAQRPRISATLPPAKEQYEAFAKVWAKDLPQAAKDYALRWLTTHYGRLDPLAAAMTIERFAHDDSQLRAGISRLHADETIQKLSENTDAQISALFPKNVSTTFADLKLANTSMKSTLANSRGNPLVAVPIKIPTPLDPRGGYDGYVTGPLSEVVRLLNGEHFSGDKPAAMIDLNELKAVGLTLEDLISIGIHTFHPSARADRIQTVAQKPPDAQPPLSGPIVERQNSEVSDTTRRGDRIKQEVLQDNYRRSLLIAIENGNINDLATIFMYLDEAGKATDGLRAIEKDFHIGKLSSQNFDFKQPQIAAREILEIVKQRK